MIDTIIVDDEQLSIDLLLYNLNKFCPDVNVIATANNIDDGLELIIRLKPTLLILDIQLQHHTVFELLESINSSQYNIVLVTAFEQYGIQAIKHRVIDYILKPLQASDLIVAVNKVKIKLNESHAIVTHQAHAPSGVNFISVADKGEVLLLKYENVIQLEAKGNYTEITTVNDKTYLTSKLLKSYETYLPENIFLRIHHSHIVNINYVVKYIRSKNGSLYLTNHRTIPISAAKKKEITDLLGLKS